MVCSFCYLGPVFEDVIVTQSSTALEVIREESDHLTGCSNSHREDDKSKQSSSADENLDAHPKTSASPRTPWSSRSPRNPRSPENQRDPRFVRSIGYPRSPRRDPDDEDPRESLAERTMTSSFYKSSK